MEDADELREPLLLLENEEFRTEEDRKKRPYELVLMVMVAGIVAAIICVVFTLGIPSGQSECGPGKTELKIMPTDIEASKLYEKLDFPSDASQVKTRTEPEAISFTDPRTGRLKWSQTDKLRIFLVPHSHNDAGWGMTFEQYYLRRTQSILDHMLEYMELNQDMKFIWSEISFFDRWWSTLSHESKRKVRKYVETKRLEFVGGGWVMPDEANVHYFSYIAQLVEGHQWLHYHLNTTPINSWAIDPFGLSSSFEYFLRKAGMKRNVFLRTHFILKEWFRETRNLEFYWRQQWANDNSMDVLCYMMPYGSYDTGDTCGPHQNYSKVCSSFREWGNEWLTPQIVENRTLALLDHYRAKSMEFRTNNLLVPIGGDFEWQSKWEWTGAVENLRRAMNYFNLHPELLTEMKFATLDEYFSAVEEDIKQSKFEPQVFSGDFFTYSDGGVDYWSGYFTSRMFTKVAERQLMAALRAAQILYTFMVGELNSRGYEIGSFAEELLRKLVGSRRQLSVFQHHDGIAGTSTDDVMFDYAERMLNASRDSHFVMQQCIHILSHTSQSPFDQKTIKTIGPKDEFYTSVVEKSEPRLPWQPRLLILNSTRPNVTIAVFNPTEYQRTDLIMLTVSTVAVKVYDVDGDEIIDSEVHPDVDQILNLNKYHFYRQPGTLHKWNHEEEQDRYVLCFVAKFAPLQIKHFKIICDPNSAAAQPVKVTIKGRNLRAPPALLKEPHGRFSVKICNYSDRQEENREGFQISNEHFTLNFTHKGTLNAVQKAGKWHSLNISFLHYETDKSGLYSFFPEGPAQPLGNVDLTMVVVEGRLLSYVDISYSTVRHRITLHNYEGLSSHALHIENFVDVSKEFNYELIMRINSQINSSDSFYTDSNGFQMMKRKRFKKLPLQGQYYPLATAGYIEDAHMRLTLLTGQPCGGSSLKSGEFEVMLDRTTAQDDHHGIGQGGSDNVPVVTNFRILIEEASAQPKDDLVPMLSLQAGHQVHDLLNPLVTFVSTASDDLGSDNSVLSYKVEGSKGLPCDIRLVGLFPLPVQKDLEAGSGNGNSFVQIEPGDTGIVVHRVGFDGHFGIKGLKNRCECNSMGVFNVADVLGGMVDGVKATLLSFLGSQSGHLNISEGIELNVMELQAFRLKFSNGSRAIPI